MLGVGRLAAGRSSGGGWLVGELTSGESDSIGVGIVVDGRYVEETASVRRRRRTLLNRLSRLLRDDVTVPVCTASFVSTRANADRAVVGALCAVLARRPELRSAAGVELHEGRVRAVVQRHHVGVRPWPFGALLA